MTFEREVCGLATLKQLLQSRLSAQRLSGPFRVRLALVIAAALTINLFFAALAGVLVPVTLKRMGFDPALAGGVILTTVTDVMGFLSFLGLATLVLVR